MSQHFTGVLNGGNFRERNGSHAHDYSETSQNRPVLEPKIMAGLEGWPVL
jgi:hypothetical protein